MLTLGASQGRIGNCEPPAEIFELGCGNGSTAAPYKSGYRVTGIDLQPTGPDRETEFPECRIEQGSAYDNLAGSYGTSTWLLAWK